MGDSNHGSTHIEIEIPVGDTNNPRTRKIKMWANILVTFAALSIAVAAAIKPPDGGSSEQVYKEMGIQVKALQEENSRQNHDIALLHRYIEDYLQGSTVVGPREAGIVSPSHSSAPVILIPIDKNKIRVSPGPDFQPILVLPAGSPPPVPTMHESVEPPKLPEFKTLVERDEVERILKEKKLRNFLLTVQV